MKKIILSLLAFSLSSHSQATIKPNQPNDSLTIYTPYQKNPNLLKQAPGQNDPLLNLTNPPLVAFGKNWRWECLVCEAIPKIKVKKGRRAKKSRKNYKTIWRIKNEYHWEDGTPVTGKDVKLTIEHLRTELPILNKMVKSILVNKNDPREFSITFRNIQYNFHKVLAIRLIHPTGSLKSYGPWKVQDRGTQTVTLARNPYYSGHRSNIARLILNREVPRKTNASLNTLKLTDDPHKKALLGHHNTIVASRELETLVINLRNPILSNIYLRKALMLSIDQPMINKTVYRNNGFITKTFTHPADPLCLPTKFGDVQIERAKDYLHRAGWIMDVDGWRYKQNKKLVLELKYPNSSKKRAIVKILKQNWRALGIEIEELPEKPRNFLKKTIPKANFKDISLLTWSTIPGSFPYDTFHSKEIPAHDNNYKGKNISGWANKKVDSLFDQAAITFDFRKQQKICTKLQNHFYQDIPMIPILFNPVSSVASKNLIDYTPVHHIYDSTLYSHQWSLAKKPL